MSAFATLTSDQRNSFIAELDLPTTPPHLKGLVFGSAFREEASPSAIDAGAVISFARNISGQQRQDVLDTALLAQLAADKRYDRTDANWYSFYINILGNVGWIVQADTMTQYDAKGQNLDVDKAILQILTAVATQNELAAITAAIDGAKALADGDGRITLFDHFAARNKIGMFQLGAASEQNGMVAMKLGSFRYSSNLSITKVLWFKFSTKNTELTYNCQAMTLNTGVYDQIRDTVSKKLGTSAKDFVAAL
jgi:hypothetical protein